MFDFQTSDSKRLRKKYRFYAFKTLTELGLSLIQNTYSSDRQDRIVDKVISFHFTFVTLQKAKEFMQDIF